MNIQQIARVCHETNKAFCESIGDNSQESWDHAEQWQRESAVKGVTFALANPEVAASAQHEAWLREKKRDGWKFGPVKDVEKKEHPCFLAYSELPIEQKTKDHLFRAVVMAFVEAGRVDNLKTGSRLAHHRNRGRQGHPQRRTGQRGRWRSNRVHYGKRKRPASS